MSPEMGVLQGDGNIKYYELSSEKPYISFLTEFRSPLPHKGLGEMWTNTRLFREGQLDLSDTNMSSVAAQR